MAQMPSKRWDDMVAKWHKKHELSMGLMTDYGAAMLLARQHAKFVRVVKKMMMQRADEYMLDASNTRSTREMRIVNEGRAWAIKDLKDDILAALQQGGKK